MSRTKQNPLAAALALLAEAGHDIEKFEADKIVIGGHNYRNNDAVAVFAHLPKHFRPGVCGNCGRTFAANKPAVGFCDDACRRENWRKTTGLEWGAVSTHDVWYGDPPMIINPDQYEKLRAIADWFTQNQKDLKSAVDAQREQDALVAEDEFEESLEDSHSEDSQNLDLEVSPVEDSTEFLFRGLQTNPLASPVLLNHEQTIEEVDDLFGF